MIMFQNDNNFLNLDNNSNQTNVLAYNRTHFTPVNSPTTSSNLSEDASIKSMNQFTLDPTIEYSNYERIYEDEQSYQHNINQLVELVDKYERQLENQNQVNNCNDLEVYNYYNGHETTNSYETNYDFETKSKQTDVKTDASVNYYKFSNNETTFKQDHFNFETSFNQQSFNQEFIKQEPIFEQTSESNNLNNDQFTEQKCRSLIVNNQLNETNSHLQSNLSTTKIKLESNKKSLDLSKSNANQLDLEKRIPRPPNAFMIFGQQNRKLLANQFPQYTNKQISKILGDEWRKMKPEEKSHFHQLADEAYAKHMKKHPGYYYSPLEARQRKADRKKKFFQKINSRRSYVKQPVVCNQTNEDQPTNKVQLISFSNSSTNETNELDPMANEINEQVKILKQQELESTTDNQNLKLSTGSMVMNNNQKINNEHHYNHQTNYQSTVLSNNLQHQQVTNYQNYSYKSKFDQYGQNQFNNQQSNNIQQNRNVLFCSHNVLQNNMMQQLINNMPNGQTDLGQNNPFFNQTNNLVNNSFNCHSFNDQTFNGHSFNDQSLYHHHMVNTNYSVPTIFHVTSKDPNLNSTLSSADFANLQTNNLSNNGLINRYDLNYNNNNLTNQLNVGLNYNTNLAQNSASQLLLTNQLLQQQIYQQQFYQQFNHSN